MARAPVDLSVGGQTFRVVATASHATLEELAGLVDEKLRELPAGDARGPRGMFLAAMMLAHDLLDERHRSALLQQRSADVVSRLVERVDAALEECAEDAPHGSDEAR